MLDMKTLDTSNSMFGLAVWSLATEQWELWLVDSSMSLVLDERRTLIEEGVFKAHQCFILTGTCPEQLDKAIAELN